MLHILLLSVRKTLQQGCQLLVLRWGAQRSGSCDEQAGLMLAPPSHAWLQAPLQCMPLSAKQLTFTSHSGSKAQRPLIRSDSAWHSALCNRGIANIVQACVGCIHDRHTRQLSVAACLERLHGHSNGWAKLLCS